MKIYQNRKNGQSMLEYIMVLAMTLGILVTLGFFIAVFKDYGGRILEIVSSDYP
ncbi:hypothetical protein P0Y35_10905 [Kiritimatiellaeota bacterium B1221]|nr:hypothetical protein [Kiritimatiellaeota bacterium B1221]